MLHRRITLKRKQQPAQTRLLLRRQFRLAKPSFDQCGRRLDPFRMMLEHAQRGLTQILIRRGDALNHLFGRKRLARTRWLIEQEERGLLHLWNSAL